MVQFLGSTSVVDLQTASTSLKLNGNDAYMNSGNTTLIPLSVVAWFASFKHNWTDALTSSFTYSDVHLGSFAQSPASLTYTGAGTSPYHRAQYASANLLYTKQFRVQNDPPGVVHSWQVGIEYLYGQKETVDGSLGHDNRELLLMAITW